MKNEMVFGTLILLNGCSSESIDESCSYDQKAIYTEIQDCVGLSADPPMIEMYAFDPDGISGAWASYDDVNNIISINTNNKISCASLNVNTRHEYIHHILHVNGVIVDKYHNYDIFTTCGTTTNDY